MLEPKEQAVEIYNSYVKEIYESMDDIAGYGTCSRGCAKIDINGKIDLLRELNEVKLCNFHKEIKYWEEVLKEVESL